MVSAEAGTGAIPGGTREGRRAFLDGSGLSFPSVQLPSFPVIIILLLWTQGSMDVLQLMLMVHSDGTFLEPNGHLRIGLQLENLNLEAHQNSATPAVFLVHLHMHPTILIVPPKLKFSMPRGSFTMFHKQRYALLYFLRNVLPTRLASGGSARHRVNEYSR